MKQSLTAVILGAGTMGTTLAKLITSHHINVILVDTNAQALQASERHFTPATEPIIFTQALKSEHQADFIIESVTENIDIKKQVLAQIEPNIADSTLIMTNTSGLSIDDIASEMKVPQRLLGAHFFNPADIIPVVEVVPGQHTAPTCIEQACEYLRLLDKRPVVLKASVPGFIANRIQHAIVRECLSLVEKGVVDAQSLDEIVKYSIGVRMALNGPLFQRDLNGLDTHLNIAGYLYKDLESSNQPAQLLKDYVSQGRIGAKAGQGFYRWDEASRQQYQEQEKNNLKRIIDIATANEYKE